MTVRELDTLIFFVTSGCNAKCRTCFYWEKLNQTNGLTFDEIRRLSSTMPRFNIVVLDANGDIRSCELRERLGNLRDDDGDWSRFWSSRERHQEIAAIERDGCSCTHVCFIHASLKASPKVMAIDVPRACLHQINSTGKVRTPRKENDVTTAEHRA